MSSSPKANDEDWVLMTIFAFKMSIVTTKQETSFTFSLIDNKQQRHRQQTATYISNAMTKEDIEYYNMYEKKISIE